MKKGIRIIAVLATLFSVTSVFAAPASLPYGWYGEINGGASKAFGKNYIGSTVRETGFAWNLDGGYKFVPFFAVEGGYTRYADAVIRNSQNNITARDRHYSYDIASKGILPLSTSGFELFGKLGVARMMSTIGSVDSKAAAVDSLSFDTSIKSATGLYLAAGCDFALLSSLSANVQWARARGGHNTGSADLYSAGINFIFG